MPIRLAIPKDKDLIISMVNEVYYSSEREFWSEGYFRIADKDFEEYLENKWVYVLEQKGIILGCVLFKQEEMDISSFSMFKLMLLTAVNKSSADSGLG